MSEFGWHKYFIDIARCISHKSKDRSTKVGCLIVGPDNEHVSSGFNGFPRGVNDDIEIRHDRPLKYMYTEHAERNAIYNAARIGAKVKGCTLYIHYDPNFCICADCARAIIQAGIIRVVGPKIEFPGKGDQWRESINVGKEMFKEAGVLLQTIARLHSYESS